jgi:radical SAM superfamily enzyme YgiQ (UPF0313 family)
LGLAYLAAALREAGHQPEILDINLWRWPEPEVRRRLAASDADAFGITGLISQYAYNKWLAELLKELHPTRVVVQGGMMVSAMPKIMLEESPGTDIIVIGEGEQTLVELADALENRGPLDQVKGLLYRDPAQPDQLIMTAPCQRTGKAVPRRARCTQFIRTSALFPC